MCFKFELEQFFQGAFFKNSFSGLFKLKYTFNKICRLCLSGTVAGTKSGWLRGRKFAPRTVGLEAYITRAGSGDITCTLPATHPSTQPTPETLAPLATQPNTP